MSTVSRNKENKRYIYCTFIKLTIIPIALNLKMLYLKSGWKQRKKNYSSILFKNIAKIWFKNNFILHFPEVLSLVKIINLHLNINLRSLFFLVINHIICHFISTEKKKKDWQTSTKLVLVPILFSVNFGIWSSKT